jgi:hypothetical protein
MHAENAFAMEILTLIVMLLALPDNSTIHSDCMSAIQTAWQVLWKNPGLIKKSSHLALLLAGLRLFSHQPATKELVKAHQDDDSPFLSLDHHAIRRNILADSSAAGEFKTTDRSPLQDMKAWIPHHTFVSIRYLEVALPLFPTNI